MDERRFIPHEYEFICFYVALVEGLQNVNAGSFGCTRSFSVTLCPPASIYIQQERFAELSQAVQGAFTELRRGFVNQEPDPVGRASTTIGHRMEDDVSVTLILAEAEDDSE